MSSRARELASSGSRLQQRMLASPLPLASLSPGPLGSKLASACEGSASTVETQAGLGRTGKVRKDVSYPTELWGGWGKELKAK